MAEHPEKARSEDAGPHYSADDVRGGEVILRTRTRRLIFIAGLVGVVLLAVVLGFAAVS